MSAVAQTKLPGVSARRLRADRFARRAILVFTLIGFGTVSYLPAFWALPSAFLTSSAAAAAVGFINCTASIGGFVGPKIFGDLSQRTGSFNTGFLVMIVCWIIASVLVLICPRAHTAELSS